MNLRALERVQLLHEDQPHEVTMELRNDDWHFICGAGEFRVKAQWIDSQRLRADIDGELIECAVLLEAGFVELACEGETWRFDLPQPRHQAEKDAAGAGNPQAPMSGAVVAVQVAPGDKVAAGDALIVIEAMKMEHAIVAQVTASVAEVLVAVGDQVDEGETLVMLEVE